MTDDRPSPESPLKLDSPLLVQWEYASEERLAVRNRTYKELVEGTNADELIFEAVREAAPKRMLEVGCGTGELARRVQDELEAEVVAVDVSPRMVELTRARGVDARVGDVESLPFADGEFDCAVAAWVLYHVPDLAAGVAELARVLRPGGTLVASTVGNRNLAELWEAIGAAPTEGLSFGPDNGEAVLARSFAKVERREAAGVATFPDRAALHRFVSATITRAHLADRVPELAEPFRTRTSHIVFVARAS